VAKYTLILLRLDKRINITVVKGKNWIADKIIDDRNTIYSTNKHKNNLIGLGDITMTVNEGVI
jgi:hypothetical protein